MASQLTNMMLKALEYCHTKGIMHRDLKPENFVFDTKDASSNMRLIDSGVAVDAGEYAVVSSVARAVSPGRRITPLRRWWMLVFSGPVACGRHVRDVWSIGVITYLLVCSGRPPFNDESRAKIARKIKAGKWKFPEHQHHKLSQKVNDFITWCLNPSWTYRPTAEEALKHPWINGAGSDLSDEALGQEVFSAASSRRRSARCSDTTCQRGTRRSWQTFSSDLTRTGRQAVAQRCCRDDALHRARPGRRRSHA
jgi:serine/threonine protein kinase